MCWSKYDGGITKSDTKPSHRLAAKSSTAASGLLDVLPRFVSDGAAVASSLSSSSVDEDVGEAKGKESSDACDEGGVNSWWAGATGALIWVSTVGRPLRSEGEGDRVEGAKEGHADGSTTSSAGAVIIIIDTGLDAAALLLGAILKGSNVSGPKRSSVGLIRGFCMMGTVF